jgi:hypothetical protein
LTGKWKGAEIGDQSLPSKDRRRKLGCRGDVGCVGDGLLQYRHHRRDALLRLPGGNARFGVTREVPETGGAELGQVRVKRACGSADEHTAILAHAQGGPGIDRRYDSYRDVLPGGRYPPARDGQSRHQRRMHRGPFLPRAISQSRRKGGRQGKPLHLGSRIIPLTPEHGWSGWCSLLLSATGLSLRASTPFRISS